MVRFVAGHTNLPVIGVGGIASPGARHGDARRRAALLQIYTGFIYSGPGLVTGLNKAISRSWPVRNTCRETKSNELRTVTVVESFGSRLAGAMADAARCASASTRTRAC